MKNDDFSSEESKSCVKYAIFNSKFLDCLKLPYVTPVHKKCFFNVLERVTSDQGSGYMEWFLIKLSWGFWKVHLTPNAKKKISKGSW